MTVDEEIIEYLEHFGVKGMHWGVKKQQVSSDSSKSKPKSKGLTREQKTKAVVAIGAGALMVGVILKTRSDVKLSKSNPSLDKVTKFLDAQKNIKITSVKSAPKFKTRTNKAALDQLKVRHAVLNTAANGDLKRWYERSQTPIHLREYLKVSPIEL